MQSKGFAMRFYFWNLTKAIIVMVIFRFCITILSQALSYKLALSSSMLGG